MILIADSSALIALAACNGLGFLPILFAHVYVPRSVFEEICNHEKPFATVLRHFLETRILDIDASFPIFMGGSLGKGEQEAMALYKQQNADALLIDDRHARGIAKANDITIIGSIGVLLLAKEHRLLGAIMPSLQAIGAAGIFISPSLVQEARRLSGE